MTRREKTSIEEYICKNIKGLNKRSSIRKIYIELDKLKSNGVQRDYQTIYPEKMSPNGPDFFIITRIVKVNKKFIGVSQILNLKNPSISEMTFLPRFSVSEYTKEEYRFDTKEEYRFIPTGRYYFFTIEDGY